MNWSRSSLVWLAVRVGVPGWIWWIFITPDYSAKRAKFPGRLVGRDAWATEQLTIPPVIAGGAGGKYHPQLQTQR